MCIMLVINYLYTVFFFCQILEVTPSRGKEKLDVAEVIGQRETTDATAARFSGELDPETVSSAEPPSR